MKLAGKVALVTGAGSGIGKSIALLFATEGADIAVNDINLQAAMQTAEVIKQIGRKAITIQANVAEEKEVDMMVNRVVDELGGVHILVNNAGVATSGPTINETVQTWERISGVVLKGTFLCSRNAGRWMISHGGGVILNMASTAGIAGSSELVCYATSKAGVLHMTRVLAMEWAKYKIRVNSISPRVVRTAMNEEAMKKFGLTWETIAKNIPLKRVAEPEDIAKAALFLVSDDASYITAVNLPVDGGYLASG